jgi:soluble lytic murein transglycosylase-like protein
MNVLKEYSNFESAGQTKTATGRLVERNKSPISVTAQKAPEQRPIVGSTTSNGQKSLCDSLVRKVVDAKKTPMFFELVLAIIEQESRCNPHAKSVKGAVGLMQVLPSTGKLVGCEDLWRPVENVRCGVSYIVRLKEKHGKNTLRSILIAYNGGPGKGGDNAVSRKYADEVIQKYNRRVSMSSASS